MYFKLKNNIKISHSISSKVLVLIFQIHNSQISTEWIQLQMNFLLLIPQNSIIPKNFQTNFKFFPIKNSP